MPNASVPYNGDRNVAQLCANDAVSLAEYELVTVVFFFFCRES